jgi:hypothetical protein
MMKTSCLALHVVYNHDTRAGNHSPHWEFVVHVDSTRLLCIYIWADALESFKAGKHAEAMAEWMSTSVLNTRIGEVDAPRMWKRLVTSYTTDVNITAQSLDHAVIMHGSFGQLVLAPRCLYDVIITDSNRPASRFGVVPRARGLYLEGEGVIVANLLVPDSPSPWNHVTTGPPSVVIALHVQWTCAVCTLLNFPGATICTLCNAIRGGSLPGANVLSEQ